MIYLLEDDDSIRELVCYSLSKTGSEAQGFANVHEFWHAIKKTLPELIILDIMLPEEDGLSLLSRLKASEDTKRIPVIMLTAKGSEYDKVTALDRGADDYITKPFGVMELTARVKAVLRRSNPVQDINVPEKYILPGLEVSVKAHTVIANGEPVMLTLKEFELMCFLLQHQGVVQTRDKILRQVWGYAFDGMNRTVDVHVRTLRTKLGPAGDVIETVRGIGYKISGD